jgi:hypothetical protein
MNVNVAAVTPAQKAGVGSMAILGLAAAGALFFVGVAALPYFLRVDEGQFRQYWPMRGWLLVHITMGMVALLTGPVQLWLGLKDRYPRVHRKLGFVYMAAIVLSSAAFLAITRHLYEQHKEWMIRSYVVTFGFVTFRAFDGVLAAQGVPLLEHIGISARFAWSVPLFLNEVVLQGRKILRVPATS